MRRFDCCCDCVEGVFEVVSCGGGVEVFEVENDGGVAVRERKYS